MGFFSKIWKGIKKTFKKIGKGIKKVFQKVGKFMNKIGIVGQIAMMFIPFGSVFGALGNIGSKALGWLNKFGAIGKGAAKVLGSAYKFVRAVAKPFVDIGKGVMGFIQDTTKFVLNKIPGVTIKGAPTSLFGEGGAWATAQERITGAFKGFTGNISDAFSGNIDDLLPKQAVSVPEEAFPDPMTTPVNEVIEASQGTGPDISSGIVDGTVSAKTSKAEKSLLEKITGEKTIGEAITAAPGKIGKYAVDSAIAAPGDLVKGEFMQGMSKAIGLGPEEYSPGPSWSSYPSQFTSSVYGATTQAMQPLEDLDIFQQRQMGLLQGDYGYSGMAEGMGYGGPDFNSGYATRLAKFAPSY